jgi:hypothetical protein
MKAILVLTIIGLGITSKFASADDVTPQDDGKPKQFQKLEIKNSQTFHMSDEEAAEANKQVVEGFQKQVEMSDPETKAAILKAQRDLQEKKTKEQNSGSN